MQSEDNTPPQSSGTDPESDLDPDDMKHKTVKHLLQHRGMKENYKTNLLQW